MSLSKNFSQSEFTHSNTALEHNIDNNIHDDEVLENVKALVNEVLQPLREALAKSVTITSGFRSWALNNVIGGVQSSQHSKGEAADIVVSGYTNLEVACYIAENLPFDQLIVEYRWSKRRKVWSEWTHVSHLRSLPNRYETLTIIFDKEGKKHVSHGLNENRYE